MDGLGWVVVVSESCDCLDRFGCDGYAQGMYERACAIDRGCVMYWPWILKAGERITS